VAAVISGSNNLCQSTANYTCENYLPLRLRIRTHSGATLLLQLMYRQVLSLVATSGNIRVTSTNACGSNTGGNERLLLLAYQP
jgi:hypothetical protein